MRLSCSSLLVVALACALGCASGAKPDPEVDAGGGDGAIDAPIGCAGDDSVCDDGIACTIDLCDPVTGTCSNAIDDRMCEEVELCDPERGCVLRPPCESDEACDDGDFCNGLETCDPATGCQRGEAPACDDGLGCTVDACDSEMGICTHTPESESCDDGIICNGEEVCDPDDEFADPNGCVPGELPDCDDGVDCTIDGCSEGDGGCVHVGDDAACSDGVFCNGAEVCAPDGCSAGTPPDCDDGIDCTVDRCDGATDACAVTADHGVCDDGAVCDGDEVCDTSRGCIEGTPVDCSDGVACTTDRCLEPSAMCEHLGSDADGDGYSADGCDAGGDCDDLNPSVNPDATEVCDGIDNDCSGGADDGPGMACAVGSAPVACTTGCGTPGMQGCTSGCTRTPCVAATETCNGCDDDGDGVADDGLGCVFGTMSACTTSCGTSGTRNCMADCSGFTSCVAATETCNGCDDDGDGLRDEGFPCERGETESCTTGCGTPGTRTCQLDCGGFGACIGTEVCNGCDDDGDGVADDGFTCRLGQIQSCTTACGTSGTRTCQAGCGGYDTCAASTETCGNSCDDDEDGMVDEGCSAPNDSCTGATTLSGTSGTLSDDFAAPSRTVTDCGSGSELWYRITVSSRSVLYVDSLGSSFDTRLSLRTSCGGASIQCEDDDCGTLQEQLVRVVDPGTYYIALHAFSSGTSSGSVALRWQVLTAGNGSYTRITGNGAFSGTTSGTGTFQPPMCGASSVAGRGPENGYYLTRCPSQTSSLTADTCTGTTYDSTLHVWGGSGQLGCNDDSCSLQSSVSATLAGPGAFVIHVDGYGTSSAGAYTLTVSGL